MRTGDEVNGRKRSRAAYKRRNCRHKARYSTWDAANADAVHVWQSKGKRANPATPFPCDLCDGYHLANYVPTMKRDRLIFRVRVAA